VIVFWHGFEDQGFFAFVGAKGEAIADGASLELGEAIVVREIDLQPLVIEKRQPAWGRE
jgi:hypothetical protein